MPIFLEHSELSIFKYIEMKNKNAILKCIVHKCTINIEIETYIIPRFQRLLLRQYRVFFHHLNQLHRV